MADEEKKDDKQVVLPYYEYQEMVRRIDNNSFKLVVRVQNENDYPIVELKDVISRGNDEGEIQKTIRRLFSDILCWQDEWVYDAKNRIGRLEREFENCQRNKSYEHQLSRELSELRKNNNQLQANILDAKHAETRWKGITTATAVISAIIIILLLIIR